MFGGDAHDKQGKCRCGGEFIKETRINPPVRPELVEGICYGLIVIDLIRSWFDKLTTNGLNPRFPNTFRADPAVHGWMGLVLYLTWARPA